MRWEILTKVINGVEWVVGNKLDSEKLDPETPRHLSKPLRDFLDKNGKPKYIFDGEQLVEKRWKHSEYELNQIKKRTEKAELRKQYTRDQEIEIHRHAIDKLALGEKLPAEYVEYRKVVDEAKQKAQDEIEELKNEI